jgi:hypothetical protein
LRIGEARLTIRGRHAGELQDEARHSRGVARSCAGLRAALFSQRQVDQSAASALIKSRGGSIEIKN